MATKKKAPAAPATLFATVPRPADPDKAAAYDSLQVRIDESERILRDMATGDAAAPFFSAFANEAVIACHRRLQLRLTDERFA